MRGAVMPDAGALEPRTPETRFNDFVVKFANVNGSARPAPTASSPAP